MRIVLLILTLGAACEPRRPEVCPAVADAPCPGASEAACAAGPEARMYGRSTFAGAGAGGTCIATDSAACRAASVACDVWGQCSAPTANPVGDCPEAASQRDLDFLASRNTACGRRRTCVATSDADCRRALVCQLEGRCAARDGVCVARSDADCRASDHCADVGLCSLVGARCTARSADECRRSRACDDWGECGLAPKNDGCTTCERSVDCAQEGRCQRVLSSDQCRATEPAHCQRSAACRTEGRCRPAQGACVK